MEAVFAAHFYQVSVGSDPRGFQCFGRDLDLLQRDHVGHQREGLDGRVSFADIEYSDFGVWHAAAISGLDPRFTFLLAVAFPWSSSHFSS